MRDEYSTKQKSYLRCSDGGSEKDTGIIAVQRFQGSASLTPFADAFPGSLSSWDCGAESGQCIRGTCEMRQKPFAASPACFYPPEAANSARLTWHTTDTNVKLIGISGGISYGALGMSHHSAQ